MVYCSICIVSYSVVVISGKGSVALDTSTLDISSAHLNCD